MIADVTVCGCDDDTAVKLEVTEEELAGIVKLAELANDTSEYSCQPRISVHVDGAVRVKI